MRRQNNGATFPRSSRDPCIPKFPKVGDNLTPVRKLADCPDICTYPSIHRSIPTPIETPPSCPPQTKTTHAPSTTKPATHGSPRPEPQKPLNHKQLPPVPSTTPRRRNRNHGHKRSRHTSHGRQQRNPLPKSNPAVIPSILIASSLQFPDQPPRKLVPLTTAHPPTHPMPRLNLVSTPQGTGSILRRRCSSMR